MAKIHLNKNGEFLVGEDRVLDFIMASLFFALFLYGLIDTIRHEFKDISYSNLVFIIALGIAILFFGKGISKRIYIRINQKGIFQDEQLVTGWAGLLNVYISQKEKVLSIKDNFILVVEYVKDDNKKGFRRNIPLTNTQNKSEEEVLEAVKFFWKGYKNSQ